MIEAPLRTDECANCRTHFGPALKTEYHLTTTRNMDPDLLNALSKLQFCKRRCATDFMMEKFYVLAKNR